MMRFAMSNVRSDWSLVQVNEPLGGAASRDSSRLVDDILMNQAGRRLQDSAAQFREFVGSNLLILND